MREIVLLSHRVDASGIGVDASGIGVESVDDVVEPIVKGDIVGIKGREPSVYALGQCIDLILRELKEQLRLYRCALGVDVQLGQWREPLG